MLHFLIKFEPQILVCWFKNVRECYSIFCIDFSSWQILEFLYIKCCCDDISRINRVFLQKNVGILFSFISQFQAILHTKHKKCRPKLKYSTECFLSLWVCVCDAINSSAYRIFWMDNRAVWAEANGINSNSSASIWFLIIFKRKKDFLHCGNRSQNKLVHACMYAKHTR